VTSGFSRPSAVSSGLQRFLAVLSGVVRFTDRGGIWLWCKECVSEPGWPAFWSFLSDRAQLAKFSLHAVRQCSAPWQTRPRESVTSCLQRRSGARWVVSAGREWPIKQGFVCSIGHHPRKHTLCKLYVRQAGATSCNQHPAHRYRLLQPARTIVLTAEAPAPLATPPDAASSVHVSRREMSSHKAGAACVHSMGASGLAVPPDSDTARITL